MACCTNDTQSGDTSTSYCIKDSSYCTNNQHTLATSDICIELRAAAAAASLMYQITPSPALDALHHQYIQGVVWYMRLQLQCSAVLTIFTYRDIVVHGLQWAQDYRVDGRGQ